MLGQQKVNKTPLVRKNGSTNGSTKVNKKLFNFLSSYYIVQEKTPPLFRENSVFVRDPFRILGSKTFDLVRKDLPPGKHMTVRKLLASTLHIFLGLFV